MGRFASKEPPTFGFGDRHSTSCARPPVALLAKNYAPIVEVAGLEPTKPNGSRFTVCSRSCLGKRQCRAAAGEHLIIFLWNLVESNHVIWIFSPAHTPCLPKFHQRRLRDSNPWGVLPPSGFQDRYNRPTLPNLQIAEAEGFEPPKPFGFTR